MKRPRQSAVRHKAGPLALLNFVVNKTASFFLYSFRQFSTWKRNWIKDDKRSNSLKIKAFSVCRNYTVRAALSKAYSKGFSNLHLYDLVASSSFNCLDNRCLYFFTYSSSFIEYYLYVLILKNHHLTSSDDFYSSILLSVDEPYSVLLNR